MRAASLHLFFGRAWTLALVRLQAELRNLIGETGANVETWVIRWNGRIVALFGQSVLQLLKQLASLLLDLFASRCDFIWIIIIAFSLFLDQILDFYIWLKRTRASWRRQLLFVKAWTIIWLCRFNCLKWVELSVITAIVRTLWFILPLMHVNSNYLSTGWRQAIMRQLLTRRQ